MPSAAVRPGRRVFAPVGVDPDDRLVSTVSFRLDRRPLGLDAVRRIVRVALVRLGPPEVTIIRMVGP
jgi:hypothetical protein